MCNSWQKINMYFIICSALILEEIAIDCHNKETEERLLQEAHDLHLSSLQLAKKAFGEFNVQTAKHYGNLGRLYQSMRKFKVCVWRVPVCLSVSLCVFLCVYLCLCVRIHTFEATLTEIIFVQTGTSTWRRETSSKLLAMCILAYNRRSNNLMYNERQANCTVAA